MRLRSFCLIASILEPPILLLDESREYAIGRDAAADLFLPARQVSRRHAKLSWSTQDAGFVIRDAWSRRGFQVNGSPTERRVLRDDDDILIDPYHLRFRIYDGDLEPLLRDDQDGLGRLRLAGRARGAELLDLVALLDIAGASVALKIDGDPQSGTLHIADGQVVAAESSFLRGSRAAVALLMAESCSFELCAEAPAGVTPGGREPPIGIPQLLGEILARMGSDFVTTLDSTGTQENEVMQLEKRLIAAQTERQMRALASKGRVLAEDVARAEELQRSFQRPLPQDAQVAFERLVRPAAAVGGGIHTVTQVAPRLFRMFIGEPVGATGIEGLLRAMLLKAEIDVVDQPGVRGADVLNLLHRRLAQRGERLPFAGSCLEIAVERSATATAQYTTDGAPALLHCHDGAALVPDLARSATADLGDGVRLLTLQLAPATGDRLFIFSSAVPRQRDPGGHEIGLARLAASATRCARLELRPAVEAIVADIDAFRGSAAQEGDFTILAAELR